MAKLTTAKKKAEPKSDFGLPKERHGLAPTFETNG
jgi:hypothetical protein